MLGLKLGLGFGQCLSCNQSIRCRQKNRKEENSIHLVSASEISLVELIEVKVSTSTIQNYRHTHQHHAHSTISPLLPQPIHHDINLHYILHRSIPPQPIPTSRNQSQPIHSFADATAVATTAPEFSSPHTLCSRRSSRQHLPPLHSQGGRTSTRGH